ncbi:MAG: nucleoside triphosphate pyrophosphohydrolase [Alphaproteobacteria bacterium]|nr:nucleoside triphosphate pyrophosphohydrolase [Alphaproteobacteria bacterium]
MTLRNIDRLIEIMARLRAPEGGCPWDLEQTFATIAPYTVEEAYEVADAIARGDLPDLKEELGDLLFQVVFHARMAEEQDAFAFEDVARAIADKMERRHPHVFGEGPERDAAAQTVSWEATKAAERSEKASRSPASALDGVALALPALMRADKLQGRAARVGFDWPEVRQVLDKIEEEIAELRAELDGGGGKDAIEDEVGDLLFALANLARHLGVDPEAALRRGNRKFERRFRAIEAALAAQGRRPEGASLEEMEALWQQAKIDERKDPAEAKSN